MAELPGLVPADVSLMCTFDELYRLSWGISWYLTGDNRIAITGGNQCLDEDATNVQIYQCTTGNTNQGAFTLGPFPFG